MEKIDVPPILLEEMRTYNPVVEYLLYMEITISKRLGKMGENNCVWRVVRVSRSRRRSQTYMVYTYTHIHTYTQTHTLISYIGLVVYGTRTDLEHINMARCTNCGTSDVALRSCQRCKCVKYCSRTCQKMNWRQIHSKTCIPLCEGRKHAYKILKDS
jgi:hypothetical protein